MINSATRITDGAPVHLSQLTRCTNESTPRSAKKFTEQTHIKNLRQFCANVLPTYVASRFSLYCFDRLLKQILSKEVTLEDGIQDLCSLTQELGSYSPKDSSAISEVVAKRIAKIDEVKLKDIGVRLAYQIGNQTDEQGSSALFDTLAYHLIPRLENANFNIGLETLKAKFGSERSSKNDCDQAGEQFNSAVQLMIASMNASLTGDPKVRDFFVSWMVEKYIPEKVSRSLNEIGTRWPKQKLEALQSFIKRSTYAHEEAYDRNFRLSTQCSVQQSEISKGSAIQKVPDPKNEDDTIFINTVVDIFSQIQTDRTMHNWIPQGDRIGELSKKTYYKLVAICGMNLDEMKLSDEVKQWAGVVLKHANSLSEITETIKEASSAAYLAKSRSIAFRKIAENISIGDRNKVNEHQQRITQVRSQKKTSVRIPAQIRSAEERAEDRQLLTLACQFIECKDQKYAVMRALEALKNPQPSVTGDLKEMDRPQKMGNNPATVNERTRETSMTREDYEIKLEQLDSRIEFLLKEMKKNNGSEGRMRRLAQEEKERIASRKTDHQEGISLGDSQKLKKLERFLMPVEDGGPYLADEFRAFFGRGKRVF